MDLLYTQYQQSCGIKQIIIREQDIQELTYNSKNAGLLYRFHSCKK